MKRVRVKTRNGTQFDDTKVIEVTSPDAKASCLISVGYVNDRLVVDVYRPDGEVELRTPRGNLTSLGTSTYGTHETLRDSADRMPHARAVARWGRTEGRGLGVRAGPQPS